LGSKSRTSIENESTPIKPTQSRPRKETFLPSRRRNMIPDLRKQVNKFSVFNAKSNFLLKILLHVIKRLKAQVGPEIAFD
jgi:hypothetical protein